MKTLGLLFHSDFDLPISVVQGMEPALHQQSPLDPKGGNQEIETHSSEAVAFQEGHEEPEANKDHHVDVLETCGTQEHDRGV